MARRAVSVALEHAGRARRVGSLDRVLVAHVESDRSIGWFDDAREAEVVCMALNGHERGSEKMDHEQQGTVADGLTFQRLRVTNVQRCESAFHPLDSWSAAEWTNAMAGEVGEACNITKKMIRGDYPGEQFDAAVLELAKELADVVIYADLVAARMGIDLEQAVIEKFNEVSDRRKSAIKL